MTTEPIRCEDRGHDRYGRTIRLVQGGRAGCGSDDGERRLSRGTALATSWVPCRPIVYRTRRAASADVPMFASPRTLIDTLQLIVCGPCAFQMASNSTIKATSHK